MPMLGSVTYMQETFVYMETAFTKNSRNMLLLSPEDLTLDVQMDLKRGEFFYKKGGLLNEKYLLGILDPVKKKQFGSVSLLTLIYDSINEVIRNSKLQGTVTHQLGIDTYTHQNSIVKVQGTSYHSIDLYTDKLTLVASPITKLNLKPRVLGKKLTDVANSKTARFNTATFLDASLETLERLGFNMDWFKNKVYTPIHTINEWRSKVIPAFIKEYKRWKKEKDFEYFLVSIDFESDGLDAFCNLHSNPSKSVYFSISFQDNHSFGVFLDMEHFDNIDIEEIAKELTYMTQIDILEDRDLVFEYEDEKLEIKRSDLTVTAHNMMIDRRFGMLIDADIWFDLCTFQLSFNLDPFMTKGNNGLKDIVTKMFGIEYAELGDICGKKNKGMFRFLTDKRVIMMYGCADTDLHRLVAKRLITIAKEAEEYYGVDHVKQHMELDTIYMNHKADNDFQGMRVNYEAFKKDYDEKTRILNLYYNFMSQYVGKVKAYKDYEILALNAKRYNVELDPISGRDIINAPNYRVTKWTGNELLDVLFKVLDYPILEWTKQNKKAKMQGKPFKPQPAVNTEALVNYLDFEASVTAEQIDAAMQSQTSLEDLKWFSMYLSEDYIDPMTGKVLISKDRFNSYRLPFMYIMLALSPMIKSVTAELKPVVESNSEYRFAVCNTTSAVTRRDLNPVQTVSKSSKYNYLPYTTDYHYGAVDQAAVEIRILYGFSKDETLIDPLSNPEKDSHTESAALMHQKEPHTITKDVRKNIKKIAFGIPYGKEVYSTCLELFGDNSPEHMAEAAYLFELYNNKLSSVMKVLNEVRDKMDEPVNPPQSLKDYLEFDPEKQYGRMINAFGYCQHLEIRPDEEWFRQALRRKAGNFIIQGFAANLLRKIYLRMLKAFWKKGWIQDRSVRIHLTVHDEIDFSYLKTLNPVEVMSILYESLTVKMKGFPPFFVGINFGDSWGEAKADESELPVLLVKEMNEQFKEGKFDNYDFGNHLHFFETKRSDYFNRRVYKELKSINENKNVWNLEMLNNKFTNYSVRALLPTAVGEKNPLIDLPKNSEDPILFLAAYLPKFIASYILDKDDRKHYIVLKDRAIQVTDKMLNQKFATLEDLFDNKPIKEEDLGLTNEIDDSFGDDDDFDIELGGIGFDFGEQALDAEEYATDGIVDLDSSFLGSYSNFRRVKDEFIEYGSIQERVKVEHELSGEKIIKFDNFKVINGKIILPIAGVKDFNDITKFCRGNMTSSGETLHLYIKHGNRLKDFHRYNVKFLRELDEYLNSIFVK